MRVSRTVLLLASIGVLAVMVVGGLGARVGAAEGTYRQTVLFAEVLSQVLDNYVDPVEPESLLRGAYEGMLGSLDPNGAYLAPDEVRRWKQGPGAGRGGPGFSVLKNGRSLQVVAVDPASPAGKAGVEVGDHVRSVDDQPTADLSLEQSRRLLQGEPGSVARIELLHPADGFRRQIVEIARGAASGPGYRLTVERGTAILRVDRPAGVDLAELARELDHARSRGVERLLVDLRGTAEGAPRDAIALAARLGAARALVLKARSGEILESIGPQPAAESAWGGSIAVLLDRTSAGAAEALAALLRAGRSAAVFGEKSYGLGAEARMYEMPDGSALLLSSARWEVDGDAPWHESGVAPDEVIEGEGADLAAIRADQLERVLERLDQPPTEAPARKAA